MSNKIRDLFSSLVIIIGRIKKNIRYRSCKRKRIGS